MMAMRWRAVLLILILLIAGFLRFYNIGRDPLWLDEIGSLEVSTGRGQMQMMLPVGKPIILPNLTSLEDAPPLTAVWTSMNLDEHPPLYFISLRIWRDVFGESDTVARAFSAVASLAAVLLLYDAVRNALPQWPGLALWAAGLMAVAPAQIRFAQEARGYSLLVLFVAGTVAAMARIRRRGISPLRGAALAGCGLGMLMTHYFGVAAVGAMGLFALLYLRGASRRWAIALVISVCILFALIWSPFFLRQQANISAGGTWQFEPAQGHLLNTLERAATFPLRLFFDVPAWAGCIAVLAYLLPLPLLRRRPDVGLFYLSMVTPIFLVTAWDLARGSILCEFVRYALAASPGACALAACALADWGPRVRHLLPAIGVIACILAPQSKDGEVLMGIGPLATELQKDVRPDDVVVIGSLGVDSWYASALALGISHDVGSMNAPVVLLTKPASPELAKSLMKYQTIWLVVGSPPNAPPSAFLGFGDGRPNVLYPDTATLWQIVTGSRRSLP